MIIDGNAIAKRALTQLRDDVKKMQRAPTVRVLWAGEDSATELFVHIKERKAQQIGVSLLVERFPQDVSTQTLCDALHKSTEDALVVQLPLPPQVDTDEVLAALPQEKDADVLSPKAYTSFISGEHDALFPPVVSAVRAVLAQGRFSVAKKHAVVVGAGRLVGEPVARWLKSEGAQVEVVTRENEKENLRQALSHAELIVSGTGVPHLIKNDFISEGVALVDAGTAESGTALVGDIDPSCAGKSVLYTPVPGGIGPITVAALFQNVVEITKRRFA